MHRLKLWAAMVATWMGLVVMLLPASASAQVRVAVVTDSNSDSAAAVAAQLNDDTFFNFTATVVTPAGVDLQRSPRTG